MILVDNAAFANLLVRIAPVAAVMFSAEAVIMTLQNRIHVFPL